MTNQTAQAALALKAEFLPFTVVNIHNLDASALHEQLRQIQQQAPQYFQQTPVIIDVRQVACRFTADLLDNLCAILREYEMLPVAIRGLDDAAEALAVAAGLAILHHARRVRTTEQAPAAKAKTEISNVARALIIDKPIRSGSQVYAKNTDLIVLSSVSPGAECIADGNIHIYGSLRGRALAGASGNTQARIFCRQLDAELLAIAGRFLNQEELPQVTAKQSMLQVAWGDNTLTIEEIT